MSVPAKSPTEIEKLVAQGIEDSLAFAEKLNPEPANIPTLIGVGQQIVALERLAYLLALRRK